MGVTYEVTHTLRAMGNHPPLVLVYDARGNGGVIAPTITGDHQNRITDYTAIVLQTTEDEENNWDTKSGRTPGKL